MVVQHNLKAMNSNRMLGITQSTQAKSTEKLSSGYKINRAADDAAGLSISEKMRKQIRGLTQASTNAQDGISAVQTAEGALNEVQDMLQRMNELAVKAANGTNSVDDRSYIQDEIKQLETEIDRVAETTKFNETYLLKGSENGEFSKNLQYKTAPVTTQTLYTVDSNNNATTISAGSFYNQLDSTATYYTKVSAEAAEKLTAADSATYFATASVLKKDVYKRTDNDYELVKAGTVLESNASYYTGKYTADSHFQVMGSVASTAISSKGYEVAASGVYKSDGTEIASGSYVLATAGYFINSGTANPMGDTVAFGSIGTTQAEAVFTDKDGNRIAANGLARYLNDDLSFKEGFSSDDLRINKQRVEASQIKEYVDNSNPYSRAKLELKLHVGADATSNNQISIKLDAMNAETLGIKDIKVDGEDDTNALKAIDTIKQALQRVSTQRSALGAVQNRLEHTIANLDNVVENTTSAESGIRDTDMATEMVKYSNNNILAQAGQAMLAQANQSNQGVLSLLG